MIFKKAERVSEGKAKKISLVKRFNGIQSKLIAAFMIPITCIVILGVVSYTKASREIIENYEESIGQTLNMTGQYYAFTLRTIETAINEFYTDPDLNDYYSGLFNLSATLESQFYTATLNSIKKKAWSDDYIENIFILSGSKASMLTTDVRFNQSGNISDDGLYGEYMDTPQGKVIAQDTGRYFWFGADPAFDEKLNVKSDEYFIRMARKFRNTDACIIVDINKKKLLEILNSLDMGENSILGIVTFDGAELLSDTRGLNEKAQQESFEDQQIFYGMPFFREAVQNDDASGFRYVDYNNEPHMFIYSKIGQTGAVICSLVPQGNIIGQASEIKNITVIMVILACMLALVICSRIAAGIGKTIKYFTKQLKMVTQGDLTVEIQSGRKDEFSILAEGINNMVSNTKYLVQKIKDTGSALYLAANKVSDSSRTFVHTAKDIKTAISEIEAGVTQLDMNSADCLNQMDTLSGRIRLVNNNTEEIYAITDLTAQAIDNGIQIMKELNDTTRSTNEITEHIIDTIDNLDKKSKSIGQIVDVINGIARQTNLLSLNASIESARAGASGRGFAVVAEEIRKLAEQSMHAAEQIQVLIDEINTYTKDSVEAAGKAKKIVELQTKAVANSTSSFNSIENQIDNLLRELQSILENVANMEQARAATSSAIEGISAVSQQTSANSVTVSITAEKQLNAVMELDSAASDLLSRAKDLQNAINQFKVS